MSPPRPGARLAVALALVAAIAAAAMVRLVPPPPRGAAAPAGEFSAARALVHLRALAADGAPRPVGSAANVAGAEAIAARLRALGLPVEMQRTFACGPYGTCAAVTNVVARLGPPGPGAVLLVAHHDSVAAGPGVSDDLSGVATVLEVARALAAGPPPPRPVVALLTDAEETGLVGASAFAQEHPWAREVGAVVNLEARGTSGPSLAFDTSGDPEWIARVLRRMPRPATTSLAAAVYDLLPNDTDLTAFERQGLPGVNLAFAHDVVRYHTPLDDLAHLDPRSLQHQGENALALVRALAEEDLEARRSARRVFFDVLGVGVLSYGRPLLVAAVAAAAAALGAWRLLRREARPVRALLLGLAAAALAPLAAAGVILLAWLALREGALPRRFVAFPGPFSAAAWAAGAGAALLAGALAGPRAGAAGLLAGAGALAAVLGVAAALALPGASYAFALPALAAGVAAWSGAGADGRLPLAAALVPAAVAASLLAPIAYLLPPMLATIAAAASAALVALAASFAAPLAAELRGRRRFAPGGAALAAALLLCAVQATLPHATAERPERLNLAYHEAEGWARWVAQAEHDALPPALRAAAAFAPGPAAPFASMPLGTSFDAPATPLHLPAPALELTEERRDGDLRRVRGRLRSRRGAPVAVLLLPPGAPVVSVSMGGVPLAEPAGKALRGSGGVRVHACFALPPDGVELELTLRGEAPVEALLVDHSPGLPPHGAPLLEARPATAVPSREGDLTIVSARVRL